MKTKNLLYGCALALLMTLGIASSPAYAYDPLQQPTCEEGNNGYVNVPPASGPLAINRADLPADSQYDTCTLGSYSTSTDIILTGFTNVSVGGLSTSGNIGLNNNTAQTDTGNLTAGGNVRVDSAHSLGTVTAGTNGGGQVDIYGIAGLSAGAISNTGGGIRVIASGTIQTPSITNVNGDVRIFANWSQASGSAQTIGSGGIGSITNNGDYGYGIYVSDPFGINYNGSNLLQVQAGSGNAGAIILDTGAVDPSTGASAGNTGTVTLAGSISADGASGAPAGQIDIFAAEIDANNITLSASSSGAQVGGINLVTNSIVDNSGLTINLNGNNDNAGIDLSIFPIGSYAVYGTPTDPTQPVVFTDYANSTNPLAISGSGDFTITANGNNNQLKVIGYPLTLSGRSGATTTITQQGNGDSLYFASTDGGDQYNVLTFDGIVSFHENTTGPGATNPLDVRGTSIAPLTGHVLLDTSGTANGDGGNINLSFDSGAMSFGGTGSAISVRASGGPTGGIGGDINVGNGGTLAIDFGAGDSIITSGGQDSNGGNITILSDSITSVNDDSSRIVAEGTGAGNGGNITITGNADIDLSSLSANGGCDGGDGGTVTLTADNVGVDDSGALVCDAPSAFHSLKPRLGTGTGNGQNWFITTTAELRQARIKGIHLDAAGPNGKGGNLYISTGTPIDFSTLQPETFSAKGGSTNAEGGTIIITNLTVFPSNRLITHVLDVSGSDDLTEEKDDGQIEINGKTCKQHNIPAFGNGQRIQYWNCDDGGTVGTTLSGLVPNTKNDYQNFETELFVFKNATDAKAFLGTNRVAELPGELILGFSRTPVINDGYPTAPSNYIVAYSMADGFSHAIDPIIKHEIGHQMDATYSLLGESNYMQELVQQDWDNINNMATCDIFTLPVCVNGVVQSPYSSMESNEAIFAARNPIFFNPAAPNQWREIWAEMYGLAAGGGALPTLDGQLTNLFRCTYYFVSSVYNQTAVNYSSIGCTAPTSPFPG